MRIARFSLLETHQLSNLVEDYLKQENKLSGFSNGFYTLENYKSIIEKRALFSTQLGLLVDTLLEQNKDASLSKVSKENILRLIDPNTFSVTTGHQLCLFTGPMYFVFKILSTIKLAQQLKVEFPEKHFVPVYWMASEDHDRVEISQTYLYGKKVSWETTQEGAVGEFNLENIEDAITQFSQLLGTSDEAKNIVEFFKKHYSTSNLADATRGIVNELFGKYGIVVIDGNDAALKTQLVGVMKDEVENQSTFKAVSNTTNKLKNLGYQVQVNPREINLFYLEKNSRKRIEKTSDEIWYLVGGEMKWSKSEILDEIESHPERFSPNVLLRAMFQEIVLPNIAYIGGPSEVAYWLQLKSAFEIHNISFPILVLRDSALFISEKTKAKLQKLGLILSDLFDDKNGVTKKLLRADSFSLDVEKDKLKSLFELIKTRVVVLDAALETAVKAELQKQLNGLAVLENKMLKALKTKEEVKLTQLEKLYGELLPNGELNERRDNFFQYQHEFGTELIDVLLENFDPQKFELKIIEPPN